MSPVGLDGLRVPVTAPPGHHIVHAPPRPENPVQRTYSGWQGYFENLNNRANPNWGNNPMGPIVENSAPGTPLLFQTPPEGVTKEEASTSGVDADTEEAEESPQQEPSPVQETEGYTVDEWPALDEFLDRAFAPFTQDYRYRREHPYGLADKITRRRGGQFLQEVIPTPRMKATMTVSHQLHHSEKWANMGGICLSSESLRKKSRV